MELLNLAESRLGTNNQVINELKIWIASGSTGGEIGSLIGSYLKELKTKNDSIYEILKPEADIFLSQFTFL